ncbi:hypothetical protein GOBAR_DD28100 [Gossypium barbadense]|nr:hypothetical protein GOBAR_DD28100 [Gossypium barbadense]
MAVTEKGGVYSFGVVTLETLMGKHPREVLPWLSSPYSLVNTKLIHVLDSRLTLPTSQLVALNIVHVATTTFAFLNAQPKFRAIMKEVCKEFHEHSLLPCGVFPRKVRRPVFSLWSSAMGELLVSVAWTGCRCEPQPNRNGLRNLTKSVSWHLLYMRIKKS